MPPQEIGQFDASALASGIRSPTLLPYQPAHPPLQGTSYEHPHNVQRTATHLKSPVLAPQFQRSSFPPAYNPVRSPNFPPRYTAPKLFGAASAYTEPPELFGHQPLSYDIDWTQEYIPPTSKTHGNFFTLKLSPQQPAPPKQPFPGAIQQYLSPTRENETFAYYFPSQPNVAKASIHAGNTYPVSLQEETSAGAGDRNNQLRPTIQELLSELLLRQDPQSGQRQLATFPASHLMPSDQTDIPSYAQLQQLLQTGNETPELMPNPYLHYTEEELRTPELLPKAGADANAPPLLDYSPAFHAAFDNLPAEILELILTPPKVTNETQQIDTQYQPPAAVATTPEQTSRSPYNTKALADYFSRIAATSLWLRSPQAYLMAAVADRPSHYPMLESDDAIDSSQQAHGQLIPPEHTPWHYAHLPRSSAQWPPVSLTQFVASITETPNTATQRPPVRSLSSPSVVKVAKATLPPFPEAPTPGANVASTATWNARRSQYSDVFNKPPPPTMFPRLKAKHPAVPSSQVPAPVTTNYYTYEDFFYEKVPKSDVMPFYPAAPRAAEEDGPYAPFYGQYPETQLRSVPKRVGYPPTSTTLRPKIAMGKQTLFPTGKGYPNKQLGVLGRTQTSLPWKKSGQTYTPEAAARRRTHPKQPSTEVAQGMTLQRAEEHDNESHDSDVESAEQATQQQQRVTPFSVPLTTPSTLGAARQRIAPLPKEQLVELLAWACLNHEDILSRVQEIVLHSPSCRRLMVRNIPFQASDFHFREFMAQFGPVEDCAVVREPNKASRGFGFVTYTTLHDAKKVLNSPVDALVFKGRQLLIKLASDPFADFADVTVGDAITTHSQHGPSQHPSGSGTSQGPSFSEEMMQNADREAGVKTEQEHPPKQSESVCRREVFVRNLPIDITEKELRELLEKDGELSFCRIIRNERNDSAYAFAEYCNWESAMRAVQQPQRTLGSRSIFVNFSAKRGQPTRRTRRPGQQQQQQQQHYTQQPQHPMRD